MVAPNNPKPSTSDTSSPKRPISRRKLRANRRNAQKSTGPRSPEGKALASRNAVSHGVFCTDLVLPGEDGHKFAFLRNGLLDATRPQDLLELALVDRMVSAQWRIERCQRAEADTYKLLVQRDRGVVEKRMARLRRRFEFGDLAELEDYCRDNQDDDPEDQKLLEVLEEYRLLTQAGRVTPPPSLTLAMSAMMHDVPCGHSGASSRALDRLTQYEQRLQNQFNRGLRELERLRQVASKWEELPPSPFAAPLSEELDTIVQNYQSGQADLEEILAAASELEQAILAAEGKLPEAPAQEEEAEKEEEEPEAEDEKPEAEEAPPMQAEGDEAQEDETDEREAEEEAASAPAPLAARSAPRKNEPTAAETAPGAAPAESCDQPPRPPQAPSPSGRPPASS